MLWNAIWGASVLPRIKTFVWRAIKEGLPVLSVIHRRLPRISQTCALCGNENESTHHAIFSCTAARQAWLASPLALSTDIMPLNTRNAFNYLLDKFFKDQFQFALNLAWQVWKGRDERLYQGRNISIEEVFIKASADHNMYQEIARKWPRLPSSINSQALKPQITIETNAEVLYLIDASFSAHEGNYQAAAAFVQCEKDGTIRLSKAVQVEATTAFEAEASGLLLTMLHHKQSHSQKRCLITTDCANLVTFVRDGGRSDPPCWKGAMMAYKCLGLFQELRQICQIEYIPRQLLQAPHLIANWARRGRFTFAGTPTQRDWWNWGAREDIFGEFPARLLLSTKEGAIKPS